MTTASRKLLEFGAFSGIAASAVVAVTLAVGVNLGIGRRARADSASPAAPVSADMENRLTVEDRSVMDRGAIPLPADAPPIAPGPFEPTFESLKSYKCPEWYADAKFGVWAHWGPQGVAEIGDWYARNMYDQGSGTYQYHVAHYGHPSKFGYKDIIQLWH